MNRIFLSALIALTITFSGTARATIIESGDLNFISDFGNASDGLAFLDMIFSVGLTQADALTNAQLTYADARIATVAEFDDLFLAAGVIYSGSVTASDAFAVGSSATLAILDSGIMDLVSALDATIGTDINIWTDPDGSALSTTTPDLISIHADGTASYSQASLTPPHAALGWLLVSDSAVVPEPSTGILVALGVLGLGISRRRVAVRTNTRP